MIRDLLIDKTAQEKAEIKATEIAKLDLTGEFVKDDITVDIQSLNKIE